MGEHTEGFTLIELMIVVAIIGILAAVAVPSFIAYRNKSYVAANLKAAHSMRSALAGYAAVALTNTYPMSSQIPDWPAFVDICNRHGATLAPNLVAQGLNYFVYHGVNRSGDLDSCDNSVAGNECLDYCIVMRANNVPQDLLGVQVEMRSAALYRQTY